MKLSKEQIFYKTVFDGYDYISTLIGKIIVPKKLHPLIMKRNYLPILYDNAEAFIDYCKCNNDYIDSDKPFLAYYMTVSGHFAYTFNDNYIASKNKS